MKGSMTLRRIILPLKPFKKQLQSILITTTIDESMKKMDASRQISRSIHDKELLAQFKCRCPEYWVHINFENLVLNMWVFLPGPKSVCISRSMFRALAMPRQYDTYPDLNLRYFEIPW